MWFGIGKRKWKRAEDGFTFLGKGARFKGSITFEGTVRIDGRLEGEIHTKGTVIVGEHAVIEGDVIADSVISGGRIFGNVVGTDKVQLISPGVLVGTVKTALFSLEEGVRFSGKCEAEGRGELRTLEQSRSTAVQSTTPRIRGVS
jgi:cytoskeletal protein CcmA (bactofilin family)